MLVITHDRDVLNEVDRIVEIKDGESVSYKGNYDAYLKQNAVSTGTQMNDFEMVENKNSKAKCFPFRHKGTSFGHEKEVLISSEAKLVVQEKKKISETTVYKHENGKDVKKVVPVYITKIDMS